MDLKSKILLVIVFVAVFASLSFTFYKTIILHDFEVVNTEEEPVANEMLGFIEIYD